MKNFKVLLEELEDDIVDILDEIGLEDIEVEDEYITASIPTKDMVLQVIEMLPDDVDFEIEVYEKDDGEGEENPYGAEPINTEFELDYDELDDNKHEYELIVFLYNSDYPDEDDEFEDESEGGLSEITRKIRITAKGKRIIKMKCKKGFKYSNKKCVKISGKELMVKRKAIRRAIRTKKAKGKGALRRTIRLRKKAMIKRKGMGLVKRRKK